jgi:hypothetical protein
MIGETPEEALFACRLPFVSKEDAQKAYDAELDNTRGCFPEWPERPMENLPSNQFTAAQGVRLIGPAGIDVGLMHFRETNGLLNIEWISVGVFWRQPKSVS